MPETVMAALPQHRPEPGGRFGFRGLPGQGLPIRVLPVAALLTAVQLLVTGSRLARSWWVQDDLNILATAADRALTPGLLFSDYNGHLIPGSWTIAWLLDRVAPLQWWPAALLTLVVVGAIDLMMLALLRRLFGTRPAILLPYAMFCATSLTLTSTLWWAAALQWLPVSLSLVAALWFHVGYLSSRRRLDAVGALLAVLLGLAFFEKALTTPLLLALFTVGYAVPGPLWRRPWRAFRQHRAYWLAQATLIGGYLWLYLARATIESGPATKVADIAEVTRLMILETLLPSLIGGPLSWYSTPATTIAAWPHPAPVLVVVAAGLTASAVIGSLVFVRGAWRAWLLLGIYLGISVTLLVWARLGYIGPFIGRDHRYLTDLAVMAPLALALAWLPLRDGLGAGSGARPRASPEAPRRRERTRSLRARLTRSPAVAATTATVAVLVMTAGGIISGETFMTHWSKNAGPEYFGNLTADLAAHNGPVYLFGDEVVPDLIMAPTFLADRQIGRVTRPLAVRPVVREAVPYFSVVDPSGHLHDGTVRGTQATIAGPICSTPTTPAIVALPVAVGAGRWKLHLGYDATRPTPARVSIGASPPVNLQLERGRHDVYVSLLAGGSTDVRVDGANPGTSVCITAATLGFPVIKP